MVTSSKPGDMNRRLKDHILNHNRDTERTIYE